MNCLSLSISVEHKKFGNETIDNDRLLENDLSFCAVFGSQENIHIVRICTNQIKMTEPETFYYIYK